MNWIIEHIKEQGEQTAVVFDECSHSYSQLHEQICRYHAQIAPIIPSKSVVAIVSDYNFDAIALFFALLENKNIIVPITTKVEKEVEGRIEIASSDFVLSLEGGKLQIGRHDRSAQGKHQLIMEIQQANSAGLILFSSGSTGEPKAMIHNLDKLIDSFQGKRGKKLTFLIFLMFDHIGGLNTMLNCVSMGTTMVFPSTRNPEDVCRLIEQYQVHILPTSPTFLNLILISEAYRRFDLSSLRMITYGTEPMPDSLLDKLKDTFPRVKFLQTFGTSETGISQTSSKSSSSTFIKLDDPDIEYKVVDGELWLRSKTQILGYLNSSMEKFTSDGWFKTGDLVEVSDDGYLKILGRGKELINVGGEKVLPSEVESVLYTMPNVKDCIVYGEANPITGQMVVARVLFNVDDIKPSQAKAMVADYCAGKLDRYKIPAKVLIMKESEYSERFKKRRIE